MLADPAVYMCAERACMHPQASDHHKENGDSAQTGPGELPKDAAAIIVTTSGNPDPGTKTFMFTAVTQLGSIPWSSKGAPQPKPEDYCMPSADCCTPTGSPTNP